MSDKSRALEAEERAEYEAREADVLRARIVELEEAARRYFNADGSVSLMVSAEAVVEARKAAARRIAELEAQVERMRLALEWAHEREGTACACGEAGEHPEDCPVANALAHLLIGGAR